MARRRFDVGGLALDPDLFAGSDDETDAAAADDTPQGAVTAAGGLSALDIPGSAEAIQALIKSSADARRALQEAREKIQARKYNTALPWLAVSAALGAPTRAGSTAESLGAAAGALQKPLEEKSAFEREQQRDLLGIDTSMAGLDEKTAMAQMSLAALRAKLTNDLAKAPNDRIVLPDGTFAYRSHEQARQPGIKAWAPPGAQTSVIMQEEGAESKTVGVGAGDMYNNMQKAAAQAPKDIARYERLAQLLEGVSSGKLKPTMVQIAAIADQFGIKLDPKLGAAQAVEALSNEVALTLRNPAGGAGMPGALSNEDRKFLVSMTPGLAKTPEGNRLMIEFAKRLSQRDQEVAKMARAYRKKNKHFDADFLDELEEWANKHPLFADLDPAMKAAATAPPAVAPPAIAAPAVNEPQMPDIPPSDEAAATEPGTKSFYDLPHG